MSVDWQKVLNPNASKDSGSHHDSFLTKVVIPLAGVAVGAIGLATAKDMPWWGLTALGLVLCILVGAVLWPASALLYAKLRRRRTRNRVANLFYPELEQMIHRFQQQLADNYSNNLKYELRNLAGLRDKNQAPIIEGFSEFIRMGEWLQIFALKVAQRRSMDFEEIAKAVNLVATQYSQHCQSVQNRLLGVLTAKSLDDANLRKLRQAWNSGRESANKVLSEWAAFSEKLNSELGDYRGTVYFPPLRLAD